MSEAPKHRKEHEPPKHRKAPKPLPTQQEALSKVFLVIEDLASLHSTTVASVRRMMALGTTVAPLGKRGRRWTWGIEDVIHYFSGRDPGTDWTPKPYTGPRPNGLPRRGGLT